MSAGATAGTSAVLPGTQPSQSIDLEAPVRNSIDGDLSNHQWYKEAVGRWVGFKTMKTLGPTRKISFSDREFFGPDKLMKTMDLGGPSGRFGI